MRIQVELKIHPGKVYSVTEKEYADLIKLGLVKSEQSDVEPQAEPKKTVKRKRPATRRKTSPAVPVENPGESLS